MRIKILILGLVFLVLIFFPNCKENTPTSPELPKNPPVINSFSANPSEIFKGESSTLSWNVSNATKVKIDHGIGVVALTGSKEVSPNETTTYTLTASNDTGQVTKKCKIKVKLNLPEIRQFKVTPNTINYGESAELYWYVRNATKVVIDHGIGEVPATGPEENVIAGTLKVSPTETTTYKCTASNDDGNVTATCTLTVKSAANVIMAEGPLYKDTQWTFTYFGIVKNIGNKKAWFTKIYIYLHDSNGNLVDYDWTYADDTELDPGETSSWEWIWWDDNRELRNKFDKSKTTYEIKWDEYDSARARNLYLKKQMKLKKMNRLW